MNDDTAQVSQNTYGEEQTQGQTTSQQGASLPQSQVGKSSSQNPQPVVSVPNKEQAPVSEFMQVSDPVESAPELAEKVKEAGVDVRQDEAKLELTREQQAHGIEHAPSARPIGPHVTDQKPEFPMTHEYATEEAKKGSIWSSLRWLAVLVLKQMKIKRLMESHT